MDPLAGQEAIVRGSMVELESALLLAERLGAANYDPGPIAIYEESHADCLNMYERMVLIRIAEQKLAAARKAGMIRGPVHLSAGQEAVAVGVARALGHEDSVFSGHRSHGHLLALGSSVHGLFAEVLGKETGVVRGRGGSMHLWDGRVGFYGSVPIVAGTVSLAVGAGLAAKLMASKSVSVAFFGDGAVEEGVLHESLNLARQCGAQTLFVCENNAYASHMHISLRQPHPSTARFAWANDIPFEVVDGNNVLAVYSAAARLTAHIRQSGGPGYLEAITHRQYGHVDWKEDDDVGINRSREDLELWRARDPISRLRDALLTAHAADESSIRAMWDHHAAVTDEAWKRALDDPQPSEATLLNWVYAT